jgi:hypothetical protein
MLYSTPPFELGETLKGYELDADGTTHNLINDQWLGQKFKFPAKASNTAGPGDAKKRRCGYPITAMAVRNVSGQTLYGKRLCVLDIATAGPIGSTGGPFATKGYSVSTGQLNCAPIDEFLETKGVADDDIFWVILEGPVIVKMQTLAAAASVVVAGARIEAGSGAGTILNLTSGGIGMTTTAAMNLIGTAMSGRTTADTGADCLIMAQIRY